MISNDKQKINYLIIALLIGLTCIAYWHLGSNNFIEWDDNDYLTRNLVVQKGLTWEGLKYAFAFKDIAYWHPMTWLSMMLDYQLFGLNPAGCHLENLFWHVINAILLFLILNRVTAKQWQSGFVAALFALHPINVESVAWLVERKTVLSTFFMLLAIWHYLRYAEKRSLGRYLPVAALMALGLMAKSMIVTLPSLLLLLDYWPLGRVMGGKERWRSICRLVLEKLPLFAISGMSVAISILSAGKRFVEKSAYPMDLRLENALVSIFAYIGKLLWPTKLIVYYPPKSAFPVWQVGGAALLLVAVTVVALYRAKKQPWLITGWFWFLIALLPVSGIIQTGLWPAMADRFAYTPFIGIYMIIAWEGAELFKRLAALKNAFVVGTAVILAALCILTSIQAGYWRDTTTLFEHALNSADLKDAKFKYPMPPQLFDYINKTQIGIQLAGQGKNQEAIKSLSDVLVGSPNNSKAHNNLAIVYERVGNTSQALYHYNESLRIDPTALIHTNVAILLARNGNYDEAITHLREALRLDPNYADALANLGGIVAVKGDFIEAAALLNRALQLDPNNEAAKRNLDQVNKKLAEKPAKK